MAFGTQDDTDEVMNEINMTPMVDIMLVLLIIFIVTVPVMQHSVNLELPKASSQRPDVKPQTQRLSVAADGGYFWNNLPVDEQELVNHLQQAAAMDPQPELHLRGDSMARYERVAKALAAAQRAGIRKIGFITEPGAP